MGLDLYFYRCKKDYYEQHAHDLKTLSLETASADCRWMNQYCVKRRVPLTDSSGAATDTSRCPEESDNIILVNGWQEHAGAAYRWLLEHTALTMEQNQPFKLNCEDIWSLYWACDAVLHLKPDEDGCIDADICKRHLPAMDDSYFGTNEYCEEYQEEVEAVAETLNILLNTIDFETEVALVQASW
ncbi:MAG: hypothetical protein J6S14_17570 [Clostridia bacterium]|nr:hypothetical protein [Clostridia bacterium]